MPGRSRAWSKVSGRLVAPITITPELESKPSIRAASWSGDGQLLALAVRGPDLNDDIWVLDTKYKSPEEGPETSDLHQVISYGEARERPEVIACDTVVLCAGQVSERSLADALEAKGVTCHVIGGADVAAELDAKRAIDQGTRLAATL